MTLRAAKPQIIFKSVRDVGEQFFKKVDQSLAKEWENMDDSQFEFTGRVLIEELKLVFDKIKESAKESKVDE